MVVDALGPVLGLNGVPRVTVGLEVAPNPRSEHWREAELSTCCVAAASSSAFSFRRTRRSSEVTTSG
jgi:hypothetical protein